MKIIIGQRQKGSALMHKTFVEKTSSPHSRTLTSTTSTLATGDSNRITSGRRQKKAGCPNLGQPADAHEQKKHVTPDEPGATQV